ncbi:MAG: bifunctional UDP-N-acetylglucosamine diphosphorylase/glucosamine-1-phosphate N-acetyltransferase GlmU, partial [Alphaproteobacteria bacterium]|nr:bifunctional UDP-N-acetylglucosamine diphosphorylase/glucosamine-1-phosphate N-acetyltransferase GlmU [Alphaproteobacteria bacterium]
RIVEYKDASEEERAIGFCNSGVMAFDGRYLFQILAQIGNNNASGEFYLTDAVATAQKMGLKCTAFEGDAEEVASANTLEELAQLEIYCKKAG